MSLLKKIRFALKKHNVHYDGDFVISSANTTFTGDPEFLHCYNTARSELGFDQETLRFRFHQILFSAKATSHIPGNIIELGTGKGFMMRGVAEFLKNSNSKKKIILCDTFQPFVGASKIKKKIYANSVEEAQSNFSSFDNVQFIVGSLPSTLNSIPAELRDFSLVHVDLNNGNVEIECLIAIWQYIRDGAIIVLDDFANPGRTSQNKLHRDFFQQRGIPILTLATGIGLCFKR